MRDAFGYVIFGVAIVGGIVGLLSLLVTGKLYEQIGRGGLSIGEDEPAAGHRAGGAGGSPAEREDEIRQLLTARNARRAARGEAGRDVEAELAELTRPAVDPGLRAEIREHVVARNARRVARGREPLDVESEVERQISELSG